MNTTAMIPYQLVSVIEEIDHWSVLYPNMVKILCFSSVFFIIIFIFIFFFPQLDVLNIDSKSVDQYPLKASL